MRKIFETSGTCSKAIVVDYDEMSGMLQNVQFIGGCNGNTTGISALVKGMGANEVIARLQGIHCGMKSTSCPDQLAKALKEIISENGK